VDPRVSKLNQRIEQSPCTGPWQIGPFGDVRHAERTLLAIEGVDDGKALGKSLDEAVAGLAEGRGLRTILPISMPIVAMVPFDLLDMAVLRLTLAPSQHHSPVGQEHGRTIPLADMN
jgi:hypothetical protein